MKKNFENDYLKDLEKYLSSNTENHPILNLKSINHKSLKIMTAKKEKISTKKDLDTFWNKYFERANKKKNLFTSTSRLQSAKNNIYSKTVDNIKSQKRPFSNKKNFAKKKLKSKVSEISSNKKTIQKFIRNIFLKIKKIEKFIYIKGSKNHLKNKKEIFYNLKEFEKFSFLNKLTFHGLVNIFKNIDFFSSVIMDLLLKLADKLFSNDLINTFYKRRRFLENEKLQHIKKMNQLKTKIKTELFLFQQKIQQKEINKHLINFEKKELSNQRKFKEIAIDLRNKTANIFLLNSKVKILNSILISKK